MLKCIIVCRKIWEIIETNYYWYANKISTTLKLKVIYILKHLFIGKKNEENSDFQMLYALMSVSTLVA